MPVSWSHATFLSQERCTAGGYVPTPQLLSGMLAGAEAAVGAEAVKMRYYSVVGIFSINRASGTAVRPVVVTAVGMAIGTEARIAEL